MTNRSMQQAMIVFVKYFISRVGLCFRLSQSTAGYKPLQARAKYPDPAFFDLRKIPS